MKTLDEAVRQHAQLSNYMSMQSILKSSTALYTPKKQQSSADDTDTATTSAEQTLRQTKPMQTALDRAVGGILTTVQFLEGERDAIKRESKKEAKDKSSSTAQAHSDADIVSSSSSSIHLDSILTTDICRQRRQHPLYL